MLFARFNSIQQTVTIIESGVNPDASRHSTYVQRRWPSSEGALPIPTTPPGINPSILH